MLFILHLKFVVMYKMYTGTCTRCEKS